MGTRTEIRRNLQQLAAEQSGYFTASQALHQGYSYQAQQHHIRAGNWERIDRGIYRLSGWPRTNNDEYVRWWLWSNGKAVISHETALEIYNIGEFNPRLVQLTVPKGFSKSHSGIRIHFAKLPAEDIAHHSSFTTTTPLRSLIDIARRVDTDQLGRAIQEAIDRGIVTKNELRLRAEHVDLGAALDIERAISTLEAS